MLNQCVLIGRTTKDVELRYTPAGKAVATIRMAVDRPTKNASGEREADFLDVIAWERMAENAANYLEKGRLIAVVGRIQIRQYEDRDGHKRERAEIVASQIRFLEPKQNGKSEAAGAKARSSEGDAPAPAETAAEGSLGTDLPDFDDDDVPF